MVPNLSRSVPLTYTANPLLLVWNDVLLFFRLTITWPITAGLFSIILPLGENKSNKLDELARTWANGWALTLHVIMVIGQLAFLLSLIPSALIGIPIPFYTPLYLGYIVAMVVLNRLVSVLLNGRRKQFWSKVPVKHDPRHDGERWVFINGVAAG